MINFKVKDIANLLSLDYKGDGERIIKKISSLENSDDESIIFLEKNEKNVSAGCVITRDDEKIYSKFPSAIISNNPKFDFFKFVNYAAGNKFSDIKPGISQKARVSDKAIVSETAFIGDFATVSDGAVIKDKAVIGNGCYIGFNSVVCENTFIYPNVVIRENVSVGKNCIIHSNSVIGSDGFGYVNEKGVNIKVPQIGRVEIGDDVEIGSCVAIDRATLDMTIIGSGTKIDNLVHIAHNVRIGKNCLILAQAGIAGSTTIGDGVIIAGQAGIVDHLKIGDGSIIMAQSGVIGNIGKNEVVFGTPARNRNEFMRIQAAMSKLPEIYKYFFKKIKNEG